MRTQPQHAARPPRADLMRLSMIRHHRARQRSQEILQRLGSHLPIDGRERMLFAEVAECVETLRKVIDAMIALFEELDLEDTRKV